MGRKVVGLQVVGLVVVATVATGFQAEARARGRGILSTSTRAQPAPPALPANARPSDRGGIRPGFVVAPAIRPGSGSRDIPTGSVGAAAAVLGGAGAATATKARPTAPQRDPCERDKLVGQGLGFCSVN